MVLAVKLWGMDKCRAELLCMDQVLGNNPNYVSYVPACGVPNRASALHHRYSTDFPVSEPPAQIVVGAPSYFAVSLGKLDMLHL